MGAARAIEAADAAEVAACAAEIRRCHRELEVAGAGCWCGRAGEEVSGTPTDGDAAQRR